MPIVLQRPYGKLNYFSAPAGTTSARGVHKLATTQKDPAEMRNDLLLGSADLQEINDYRNVHFEKSKVGSCPFKQGKSVGSPVGRSSLNYFTYPAGNRMIRQGTRRRRLGAGPIKLNAGYSLIGSGAISFILSIFVFLASMSQKVRPRSQKNMRIASAMLLCVAIGTFISGFVIKLRRA